MEIVLTEDDLAAIIAESTRTVPRSPAPADPPWDGGDGRPPGTGARFTRPDDVGGAYSPIADAVWGSGIPRPGALDEAIQRILDATTLKPIRPAPDEEAE